MRSYIAGDYAGFDDGKIKLYYGYEVTDGTLPAEDGGGNWCFQLSIEGKPHTTIPFPELGARDPWDCGECLLEGIALLLERGILGVKG